MHGLRHYGVVEEASLLPLFKSRLESPFLDHHFLSPNGLLDIGFAAVAAMLACGPTQRWGLASAARNDGA